MTSTEICLSGFPSLPQQRPSLPPPPPPPTHLFAVSASPSSPLHRSYRDFRLACALASPRLTLISHTSAAVLPSTSLSAIHSQLTESHENRPTADMSEDSGALEPGGPGEEKAAGEQATATPAPRRSWLPFSGRSRAKSQKPAAVSDPPEDGTGGARIERWSLGVLNDKLTDEVPGRQPHARPG